MLSIEPDESRVVLIGSSRFPRDPENLPELPAIEANLQDLERLLMDTSVSGIPRSNIIAMLDVEQPTTVAERLAETARETHDTLIVYYAGHGLIGRSSELRLATATTKHDLLDYSSLDFELVRQAIRDSPAKKRVLILDCCFSGRAIEIMGNTESVLRAGLDIKGTYAIASAPATRPAMAPDGARYTAFTGELIGILEEGLDNHAEEITLEELYDAAKQRLTSAGLPEPQRANFQTAGELRIARNRKYQLTIQARIETLERQLDQQSKQLEELLKTGSRGVQGTEAVGVRPVSSRTRLPQRNVAALLAIGPVALLRLADSRMSSGYQSDYEALTITLLTVLLAFCLYSLLVMFGGNDRLYQLFLGGLSARVMFWASLTGLVGVLLTNLLFPFGS